MKRIIALIFVCVIAFATSTFAKEEIYYILKPNFRVSIIHLYKMTETTKVKRILDNGDTLKYNRDIEYYMSLYPPANAVDGFFDIDVSIDSINYKFSDGKVTKEYSTMGDKPAPLSFQDYEMVGPTVGKKYSMTYSPYGEVSTITGENLQRAINMLDHKALGIKDPVQRQIWQNAYSFDHLTYLADVTKNYFPSGKISKDSTWKKVVSLDLNRVYFEDTLQAKIEKITSSKYQIRGSVDSLKATSSMAMLYDIKEPVKVVSAKGNGIFDVDFTPAGVIEFVNGDFITEVKYKHKNKEIREIAEVKISWELLDRLTY